MSERIDCGGILTDAADYFFPEEAKPEPPARYRRAGRFHSVLRIEDWGIYVVDAAGFLYWFNTEMWLEWCDLEGYDSYCGNREGDVHRMVSFLDAHTPEPLAAMECNYCRARSRQHHAHVTQGAELFGAIGAAVAEVMR